MEDVASIEFDSAGNTSSTGPNDDTGNTSTQPSYQPPANTQPTNNQPSYTPPGPTTTTTTSTSAPPTFFQINIRVRADNASNGWTNSGLVVRRGQRLRITASGRVSIGNNRFSTPDGLPNVPDRDQLMRNQPTRGLIPLIAHATDHFFFAPPTLPLVP